ncbi:amino acid permease [Phormidesmis priestleyi ULC007]|uniref:Amino acid permease n=1 Tax=Phormidesmis priestleyi ULC007 TaxID=1920490 RepID=A0A2T1DNA0_9CYAN|nr:basic amino acid/polyamine antiporter [Phormidesmis priestleyi]PSB21980.1 amino acid permease [Phormidesmis priestleyi ULC007]PZO55051.1 MAG: amino acid permease [Phormidesmis priestleyi]
MASEQNYNTASEQSPSLASDKQTLSVAALTALVVGSMVGAGIFTIPSAFGRATGVLGGLIAWVIAGVGMLMLAFVFQNLAQRKPDLDSGIFAYAKTGFGNYIGFLAALAFWASTCVGNTSYFVLIKSTLGEFFPVFGDGNTVTAVFFASIILWIFHFMILRGVKQATGLNTIVTIAKIVPIVIFIFVLLFAFKPDIFAANFWGGQGYDAESLFSQVRNTMLVTVFVFIGIEGASVYSRYAEKRSDVGVATVLGFVGVLCLLILVTVLPYGILPRAELGVLRNPSMAGLFESVVGRWGNIFISLGLLVSVLGAFLAWTLFASEVPFMAAKSNLMPSFLARENSNGVPSASLWMTNITVQAFLIATLFSQQAFILALELTSSLALIPYLLVAAFALKLAWSGETYDRDSRNRTKELVIAAIATAYSILMIYAGGLEKLLLSGLILAPGTILFFMARREQNRKVFTFGEWFLFSLATIAALSALFALSTGRITI